MTVTTTPSTGFRGARVILFESRMVEAMAKSVVSHGGQPIPAPSMQELPLADNPEAHAFGQRLMAGEIDVLLCLTGVGTRLLVETLSAQYGAEAVMAALGRVTIVARGPKPVQALKSYNLPIALTIPEPNTWREILQTFDEHERGVSVAEKLVAIQEYGISNEPLIRALKQRGARVMQVPVYRWAMPDDTAPLLHALHEAIDGRAEFALFTNAAQIRHVMRLAAERGLEPALRQALKRIVVASVGPTTTEALLEMRVAVDFEPTHPKMGPLIGELAVQAEALRHAKTDGATAAVRPRHVEGPDAKLRRAQSPFLTACRREPTSVTPVWFMRQAGRYMKSYRELRNKVPFLELCKRPELIAEVTVSAVETIGADAAIVFSDILLIVESLGLSLQYEADEGPVVEGQIGSTAAEIDRLPEIEPAESLHEVFEGVRLTRETLPAEIPLIGFAGAPFTLAAYIIEGGGSKTFLNTKRLMYRDPGAWHALLDKLDRGLIKYLNGQIAAGADAVQLFDTWVGCLGPRDYQELVLPHTRAVIQGLTPGVPVIHFSTGTASCLPLIREAGGEVIGVDFRVALDEAWRVIGHDRAIQGNLDPVVLCTTREAIRRHVARILEQADGRPGHIFNLGHGVLPSTPVEHVMACIDAVHELSHR